MPETIRESGIISLNPYLHEHVAPSYLINLKKYRYSSSDLSITSRYIMRHYWEFVIGLIPMSIAPNMLTLIGFACGISSTIILLYYYFFCNGNYPAWCWYFAAIALFMYQTLDAIDGKQARRTETGSPLGELFDHGCDALISVFVLLNVTIAMNFNSTWTYASMIMCAMSLFFSIWEQYSTGTLEFGYISAPTEGILIICFIFAITGLRGRSVWDTSVFGPVNISFSSPSTWFSKLPQVSISTAKSAVSSHAGSYNNSGNNFVFNGSSVNASYNKSLHSSSNLSNTITIGELRSCFLIFYIVSFIYTTFNNLLHVATRPSVHNSHATSFIIAGSILLALVLHLSLYFNYREVQQAFPFAMEVSFGLLVAQCATRLTISRICAMPYKSMFLLYVLHIFTLVGVLLLPLCTRFTKTTKVHEHTNLYKTTFKQIYRNLCNREMYVGIAMECLVVFGLLLYLHLIISVFLHFAHYLHINILTIAPRKLEEKKKDDEKVLDKDL